MAERVAGTLDVNAAMAAITPLQFEEWIQYRNVWGDPFERIIETLKLGFASLCQVWGSEIEPEYFETVEARKQQTDHAMSGQQIQATLAPALGQPKRGHVTRRSRSAVKRSDDGV